MQLIVSAVFVTNINTIPLKGATWMKVAIQMKKAIATVQSTAATIKTFVLETVNKQEKHTFQQLTGTFDDALMMPEGRRKYSQDQESQYCQ